MKKRFFPQVGFTLVELVVVITIVGIMSAVALSKYVNIQSQARIAKAQAIFGAIRTAAVLAKSACQLDLAGVSITPTCTTTGGTVDMDGTFVSMLNQYPDATLSGIIAATQLNPALDGLILSSPGATPLTIDIYGGSVPNCRISYMPAATIGTQPIYNIVTTGC
jgi:MSHA pilin protein MshA